MKLKYAYFFAGLILAIASSCKKDIIEIPESNSPIFHVEGMIDGESFGLVAGDNNVYMETMTLEENGVSVFSGRMAGQDLSIEIGVYDGNIDLMSTTPEPTTILPVFSQVSSTPLTVLSKNAFENAQNISSIAWYVDGNYMGLNNYSIYAPGIYDVCAEITFYDGYQKTVCDKIIVGYNRNANCELNVDVLGGGLVNVAPANATADIDFINWYVDSVYVGQSLEFETTFSTALATVTADVHFANGVVRTKSVVLNGYDSQKVVNDFTMFENEGLGFIPRDYNIRIKVTKNGEAYYSDLSDNSSSKVIISAVEYFGLNDAGFAVFKVSGTIGGKLQHPASGSEMNLSMNIVFGVEVK